MISWHLGNRRFWPAIVDLMEYNGDIPWCNLMEDIACSVWLSSYESCDSQWQSVKLLEGRDLTSKPGWNLGFSRKITENLIELTKKSVWKKNCKSCRNTMAFSAGPRMSTRRNFCATALLQSAGGKGPAVEAVGSATDWPPEWPPIPWHYDWVGKLMISSGKQT